MPIRRSALLAIIGAALALPLLASLAVAAPPPGPPFPTPELNRAVYDQAEVFRPATVAKLEQTIDAIEARTGAEVVVYTQEWPYKIDQSQSESNAAALIDQWGIGRRGFDDSLVIMFDLDPSLVHGQVSLYAGSGFRATFLSDSERQAIFDNDMLPLLQAGDLDGAALVAMAKVDAAATPEHAQRLEFARQANAVIGIVGGGIALIGLIGWAVFHWLRFGRDPIYVDSASVLVPAPPDGMTAAAGTAVLDGAVSRRTLTTALLDLASRGEVAFRQEKGFLGLGSKKLAIDVGAKAASEAQGDLARVALGRSPVIDAAAGGAPAVTGQAPSASAGTTPAQAASIARSRLSLADRRPISGAESYLLGRLHALASDDSLEPEDVLKLATDVSTFDGKVEDLVVTQGWFGQKPSSVVSRWRGLGFGEGIVGVLLAVVGLNLPASGLTLLGAAIVVAGVITIFIAPAMPARTMAGAMQRAWLNAYRRTLAKTMEQARSMDQVVAEAGLDWLETPDQALVWSVALGLTGEVQDVLGRTLADSEAAGTQAGFMPLWYRSSDGTSLAGGMAGGGGGLFSSSGIPDLGGMFSALGTIGNAPSSGGSGGGGFSGGGSGGGGGAGGGF